MNDGDVVFFTKRLVVVPVQIKSQIKSCPN